MKKLLILAISIVLSLVLIVIVVSDTWNSFNIEGMLSRGLPPAGTVVRTDGSRLTIYVVPNKTMYFVRAESASPAEADFEVWQQIFLETATTAEGIAVIIKGWRKSIMSPSVAQAPSAPLSPITTWGKIKGGR